MLRPTSILACCFAVACQERTELCPRDVNVAAPVPGTIVARVGALAITTETLRARIEAQDGGRERLKDPKELKAFVDNQIRFELLVQEALRQGLERDPEVQDAAKRTMVQKLIERRLEDPGAIDDAAVAKEYELSIGDYHQPDRVQATIMELDSVAKANAVWRALALGKNDALTIAQLRKQYTGNESNRDLELKYWSEEELKASYGAELAKAIFSVQQLGEVGPVTRSAKGFYVFKLTGRRAAFHRPLADVTGTIKKKLAQRRRNDEFEAYVDRLRGETEVSVDERALGEVTKEP